MFATFRNWKLLFRDEGRWQLWVIGLFVLMQGLVIVNAVLHNPEMGYDADDHLSYMQVLPERLPSSQDTREFFSAPLPYFIPGVVDEVCTRIFAARDPNWVFEYCRDWGGNTAQGLNVLLSFGAGILMLSLAQRLRPGSWYFKVGVLLLLTLLTVYYKTFAQVRGEPYVVFFTVWILDVLFAWIDAPLSAVGWQQGVGLGVLVGLLMLSRQWGAMLIPVLLLFPLMMFWVRRRLDWGLLRTLVLGALTAALVGGWFYVWLLIRYDTLTAFNLKTPGFSFANQPYKFYRHTGLEDWELFRVPIRENFANEFMPIMYSDTWGDYWGYFVFIRAKSYLGEKGYENGAQIAPYLGRVNLVSLYPTFLMALGLLLGLHHVVRLRIEKTNAKFMLMWIFLVSAGLMYGYFVIAYPDPPRGATIKPTYVLHALIVLPLFAADFLETLRRRSARGWWLAVGLLVLVLIHNLPAMVTRYNVFL